MTGKMLYQDSLKQSLDMLRPSKADIDLFLGSRSTIPLSPGVQVLVKLLHTLNKDVYLVSGGFTQVLLTFSLLLFGEEVVFSLYCLVLLKLIDPVADLLHIPRNNVFAIRLQFDSFTGEYNGYDETAPTSREHGKSIVVQSLLTERYASFPQTGIVMIGDGNNDLQAKPPASLFIGYGGNIVREHVKQRADWFITDFQVTNCVIHVSSNPLLRPLLTSFMFIVIYDKLGLNRRIAQATQARTRSIKNKTYLFIHVIVEYHSLLFTSFLRFSYHNI